MNVNVSACARPEHKRRRPYLATNKGTVRIQRNIHDLRSEATQIQFLRERVMSLMAIERAEKRTTTLEAQAYAALQPAQRAFLKTWPFWGLRKLRDLWKTEEGLRTPTHRRTRQLRAADRAQDGKFNKLLNIRRLAAVTRISE